MSITTYSIFLTDVMISKIHKVQVKKWENSGVEFTFKPSI